MTIERFDADAVVIGGGIIGLMTAWKLIERYPENTVVLLEKERYLGDHSTGRNSGVLHAGIYYPHASLKHRLCLEGRSEWIKLAEQLNIPYRLCGKFIFAADHSELPALEELHRNAIKNEVPDFRFATADEKARIREFVHVHEALYSPHSGILDVSEALARIRVAFESKGGIILCQSEANVVEREDNGFSVKTQKEWIHTHTLYNCAGLDACKIRKLLDLEGIESLWVKGNYLKTSQKLNHPHLFYPVPLKELKGLGVHSTLDMQGDIKFGPNTEDVTELSYSMNEIGMAPMYPEIEKRFKGVDLDKLRPDYCGIRSKITETSPARLYSDFWIRSGAEFNIPGYAEACGIESPGLTASPKIATMLIDFNSSHYL